MKMLYVQLRSTYVGLTNQHNIIFEHFKAHFLKKLLLIFLNFHFVGGVGLGMMVKIVDSSYFRKSRGGSGESMKQGMVNENQLENFESI